MDFGKENTLNASSSLAKEVEGVTSALKETKLSNNTSSKFVPSKTSHFSHPRNNHHQNQNYRKRNPPMYQQKQSYGRHQSHSIKPISTASSFLVDESCAESKSIDKIPSAETASASGHSTESAESSGSSSPVSIEMNSHTLPPQSTAYRSQDHLSKARANPKSVENPYSFQPNAKDYQLSQAMMLQKNQMYQSLKIQPDVAYIITQLSYQAKDFLYLQQENLSKFYEDKRAHELSRLSSLRNKASEVESSK